MNQDNPTAERPLTIEEVAAEYRIPLATLRYWRVRGEGPTVVAQWLAGDPIVLRQVPARPYQPRLVSLGLADGSDLVFVAADLVTALMHVAGLDAAGARGEQVSA